MLHPLSFLGELSRTMLEWARDLGEFALDPPQPSEELILTQAIVSCCVVH